MVQMYNEIRIGNKKGQNIKTPNNVDEPQKPCVK